MVAAYETTKYVPLNQQVGWRKAANSDNVVIDAESGQLHLQVLPGLDRPLTDANGDFGGLVLPTSIAEDNEGRLYILDGGKLVVKRFDPCLQMFETLPWLGGAGRAARQFLDPKRIAISTRNDLYVADTGNRRVQVFALKGLSLRAVWGPLHLTRDGSNTYVKPVTAMSASWQTTPNAADKLTYPPGTWQPWDIALSSRNVAYVSDYANGLIHVFDAWGQWITAFKGDTGEQPALEKPTHITLDRQERLYIIQEGKDYVTVLDSNGTFLKKVQQPADIKGDFRPLSIAVDEAGNIYLCDGITRRLYYYCHTVDDSYAEPATCRDFYCCGTALTFDKVGNPLLVDAEQQRVLLLKPTILYNSLGTYYSEALDSNIYRCQWHRVLLSAHIPPGTSVRVDTYTAEAPKTIEEIQQPDTPWETGQIDSQVGCADWDCLIRSLPGRYLWLRLQLTGESMATPAIEQVRVYYPRSSSLQYLPATYSEDPESRDFLERFLSIFDTMRDEISRQITDIASYFDPGATPASKSHDFLSWLGSWIGLTVDRHWPEERRRQLVKQAHRLYALRGTPEGLRQHILLYLGTEPYILEHFKLRRWLFLDHARLGDQNALWGKRIIDRLQLDQQARIGSFQLIDTSDPVSDPFSHYAHQFTIFIPMHTPCSPTQQQTLQRIIEMAKPAHTQGYLKVVQPRFRIGIESLIGIDTVLGRYPDQTITGESKLGYESVLGTSSNDKPPTMRIGTRSRIGSSTLLD